ncbi:hypothetical protein L228DRAFT_246846, partial [Xylona heveae TC161]
MDDFGGNEHWAKRFWLGFDAGFAAFGVVEFLLTTLSLVNYSINEITYKIKVSSPGI